MIQPKTRISPARDQSGTDVASPCHEGDAIQMQSCHSVQAQQHFYCGDLKGAEACCRRMLAKNPYDHEALLQLGDIAAARGDLRAAASLYRRVREVYASTHATDRLVELSTARAWQFQ